jgi:hypothetical protein
MPRYMFVAGAPAKGSKRLTVTAAKARRARIEQAVIDLDGRLETLDGAFGEAELYTICELPTNVAAASFASLMKSCQARPVRVIALPQPRRRVESLPSKV